MTDKNGFETFSPFEVVEGYHTAVEVNFSASELDWLLQTSKIIQYKTLDLDASGGSDFVSTSGSITFSNQSSITIPPIKVLDNSENEEDEQFALMLSSGYRWYEYHFTISDTLKTIVTNSIEKFPKVENLKIICPANVDGTGNTGNNIITGNIGKNTLRGLAGNDTLIGGSGNDILIGGTDDDTLIGVDIGKKSIFGRGEIDILTGGSELMSIKDRDSNSFLLGNKEHIFYDDSVEKPDVFTPITIQQLQRIANSTSANLSKYLLELNKAMEKFNISTPERQRVFIAQTLHESGGFQRVEEDLSYSKKRLQKVFGKERFSDSWIDKNLGKDFMQATTQAQYEKIANRAYAKKNGNGNEASGDGWKYRGRGFIQLTGKANYREAAQALNNPLLLSNPDQAFANDSTQLSVGTAAWFWAKDKKLNALADDCTTGDDYLFKEITSRINGGLNGYQDRLALYQRAEQQISTQKQYYDYAIVKDFHRSQDYIQLKGSPDDYYILGSTNSKINHPCIILNKDHIRGNTDDELIAVVEVAKPLDIHANYFKFV